MPVWIQKANGTIYATEMSRVQRNQGGDEAEGMTSQLVEVEGNWYLVKTALDREQGNGCE